MDPSEESTRRSGELLPILPSSGCRIIDVVHHKKYEIRHGKKLCIPRQLMQCKLQVQEGSLLYALWKFRTEEDMGLIIANTKSIEIRLENLSYLEDKIVSSLFYSLSKETAGMWQSAIPSDNIQQCRDKPITHFVWAHLHKKVNIIILYLKVSFYIN